MRIMHRALLLALLLCLSLLPAAAEGTGTQIAAAALPIDLTGGAVPSPEGFIGEWEY